MSHTDDPNNDDEEFFQFLNEEEALEFQFFMMQKVLKKFNYTESSFINDFICSFQRLIKHLVQTVGELPVAAAFELYATKKDIPFVMVNYYLSLLDEDEGGFFEDDDDE